VGVIGLSLHQTSAIHDFENFHIFDVADSLKNNFTFLVCDLSLGYGYTGFHVSRIDSNRHFNILALYCTGHKLLSTIGSIIFVYQSDHSEIEHTIYFEESNQLMYSVSDQTGFI
jgi:hypothetical protein